MGLGRGFLVLGRGLVVFLLVLGSGEGGLASGFVVFGSGVVMGWWCVVADW